MNQTCKFLMASAALLTLAACGPASTEPSNVDLANVDATAITAEAIHAHALVLDDENDVVIFTDGSWPEPGQSSKPMIGAVVFDKVNGKAWSTAMTVPEDLIREWLPRKTQIAMVEMLAPIVVNEVFKGAQG